MFQSRACSFVVFFYKNAISHQHNRFLLVVVAFKCKVASSVEAPFGILSTQCHQKLLWFYGCCFFFFFSSETLFFSSIRVFVPSFDFPLFPLF